MKISTHDCLSVLRRFAIADETNVPKDIERLVIQHPTPVSQLGTFRFGKKSFALLFDDTLDDDPTLVEDTVRQVHPNAHLEIIANPTATTTTYGMPYEAKDCYLVAIDANRMRLDVYLASKYPEYSRSSWQKFVKAGYVTIDSSVQKTPKYEVTGSEAIDIHLPEAPSHDDKTLPILYIDDDVIVINKPAGILTHHKNQLDTEFTVADFFRRYTTYGLDTDRPGIVHRLDRDTSGVMIGARHKAAYEHLKQQFSDRLANKTYEAVLDGTAREPNLLIDLPILRSPTSPGSFMVNARGKSAQTQLDVIKTDGRYTLVQLKPHTGRTHQLRVHMAYLRTPIHGDRLYGKPSDRLYLHASTLEITIPNGQTMTFSSPRPSSFDRLVAS